jgi:hypothetical protein
MSKLEQYPGLAKATAISLARRRERRLAAANAKAVTPKRSPGRPKGIRTAIHAMKKKIEIRGLDVVNRNTFGGKMLFLWRKELVDALGGEDQISPQIRTLIDLAVGAKLYIDHIDSYCMSLESIINRGVRSVYPIIRDRAQLAAQLEKTLTTLGLQRQAKQLETLQEYSERRRREIDEAHARGEKDVDEIDDDDDDDEAEVVQHPTIEPVEPEPAA